MRISKQRKRNQIIAFRTTKAEKRKIEEKVKQSGLSQREYLLKAALGHPIYVMDELKPILSELRSYGRNLNQLTILAHEDRVKVVDLQETISALENTYTAINSLLTSQRGNANSNM